MQVGMKIYYDLLTGEVIQPIGQRQGYVVETTREQDFATYAALAERVPEAVGMVQLEYGQYEQDFAECGGNFRVDISDPSEPKLVFSYPDPVDPDAPPVYHPPLSVQVAQQQQTIDDLTAAIADLMAAQLSV
ncbi:hypothetical protein COLU111180_06200 [Cohnella lubricantis]|uniref:Uncharacterized protein n=1 Tax=Cohnella lubricantis TaxID=2163172 RepID=A0A841TE73_9BACL|nr:hypothetical protein [Cohnella lubricantis]MBB6677530.1 hypothetical protein [Cohnella lubricantis]MBP2116584.1 hypothetical protein [Cohnella lubricantis]